MVAWPPLGGPFRLADCQYDFNYVSLARRDMEQDHSRPSGVRRFCLPGVHRVCTGEATFVAQLPLKRSLKEDSLPACPAK
jgi:hypothetical protein